MNRLKRGVVSLRAQASKTWTSLAKFEEALGGRTALVESLESGELDAKQQVLLRLLTDPARRNDSLAKVCADANVKAAELIGHFREVAFTRALTEAQLRLADRLPEVVEDVAEKALNHIERCGCTYSPDGDELPALEDCPSCAGKGIKFFRSSFSHQQLLLEAAELLKRGGGVNVNVNQNTALIAGPSFFHKFVKATDPAISIEASRLPPSLPPEGPTNAPQTLPRHDQPDQEAQDRSGTLR